MGERFQNPSPDPSPKRGGEQDTRPLTTEGEEQESLPLPASGRGLGGGVASADRSPIRNPSSSPSPKPGGEQASDHSPALEGDQESLPLPVSGRGTHEVGRPGGGVAPITPVRNIVIGQRVDPAKVLRAKELRRQMTPAERRLWECLRANRLGGRQFRRQQVIDGFIVDFYCHAAAVVVEVDGPVHEDRADYDAERDRILTARGLRVVRFTNEQVDRSLPAVLRRIEAICRDG